MPLARRLSCLCFASPDSFVLPALSHAYPGSIAAWGGVLWIVVRAVCLAGVHLLFQVYAKLFSEAFEFF